MKEAGLIKDLKLMSDTSRLPTYSLEPTDYKIADLKTAGNKIMETIKSDVS